MCASGSALGKTRDGRALLFVADATTEVTSPFLPGGRRPYEIAMLRIEPDGTTNPIRMWIDVADLDLAEQDRERSERSLAAGRFHERHPQRNGAPEDVYSAGEAATIIAEWCADQPVWVGYEPHNDAANHLWLLHTYNLLPVDGDVPWDRHLVCVGNLITGRFGIAPHAWNMNELAAMVGVDPTRYRAHEAAEDVRMRVDMYTALMRLRGPRGWLELQLRRWWVRQGRRPDQSATPTPTPTSAPRRAATGTPKRR